MKIVRHYSELENNIQDQKSAYLRYRVGKIKHALWLKTRKSNENYITKYDEYILKMIQPGKTGIFGSAGYFLDGCIKDLTVIEREPIVKSFFPRAEIVKHRKEIGTRFPNTFDNFIVTNNRADLWVDANGLCEHLAHYREAMKNDCLFFYSMRDTQLTSWNRFKINHYQVFIDLAKQIERLGFECLESQIEFANGDGNENPDTSNGNIKYLFKCIK